MKKLLFALMALFVMGNVSFAQEQKPAKQMKKPVKEVKQAGNESVQKAEPVEAQPRTKKDGSLDMRFKNNKAAKEAAPAGPVKKDGTPDKRYKANKAEPQLTK